MELAGCILFIAGEGDLRLLVTEQTRDFFIYNIAYLIVVLHDLAVLVADTPIPGWHQCIASLVCGADIAVDSGPALVTVAFIA